MSDSRPIQPPELRGDWNTHMPCGHLRQFGTLGEVFPVHCLACENAQLRAKLRETKGYLRAANKGAERNSIIAQLLAMRNVKLAAEMDAIRTVTLNSERIENPSAGGGFDPPPVPDVR